MVGQRGLEVEKLHHVAGLHRGGHIVHADYGGAALQGEGV